MSGAKQCSKRVYSGERHDMMGHPCQKTATVTVGGKSYCATHSPVAAAEPRPWYALDPFGKGVSFKELKVEKATEHWLFVRKEHGLSKYAKADQWNRWFRTKAGALQDGIERREAAVEALRRQVKASEELLEHLRAAQKEDI
jgi:hypothetical protein